MTSEPKKKQKLWTRGLFQESVQTVFLPLLSLIIILLVELQGFATKLQNCCDMPFHFFSSLPLAADKTIGWLRKDLKPWRKKCRFDPGFLSVQHDNFVF